MINMTYNKGARLLCNNIYRASAVICSWVNGRLILLSQIGSTGHVTCAHTTASRQLA